MTKKNLREKKRVGRHERIRKRIKGTVEQPRVCLYRSLNHLRVQLIDDVNNKVLFGLSTLNKEVRQKIKSGGNVAGATALGLAFAELAKEKGVSRVCFDRGGYLYHGRVKAFAEAARKGGLQF